MRLLLEAAGVGVALSLLPRLADPRGAAASPFVSMPVLVASVVAAAFAWPVLRGMVLEAGHDASLSPRAAALRGSTTANADADFFAWVGAQVPAGDTFVLMGPALQDFWGTYQLLPRREVTSFADADYLVFYGESPHVAGAALAFFPRRRTYATGFSIAGRS